MPYKLTDAEEFLQPFHWQLHRLRSPFLPSVSSPSAPIKTVLSLQRRLNNIRTRAFYVGILSCN